MARTHDRSNRPQSEGSATARTQFQAETPVQAQPGDRPLNQADVAALQRHVGNQAVQRLLRRSASVPKTVPQTLRLQRARFRANGDMLPPQQAAAGDAWDDDAEAAPAAPAAAAVVAAAAPPVPPAADNVPESWEDVDLDAVPAPAAPAVAAVAPAAPAADNVPESWEDVDLDAVPAPAAPAAAPAAPAVAPAAPAVAAAAPAPAQPVADNDQEYTTDNIDEFIQWIQSIQDQNILNAVWNGLESIGQPDRFEIIAKSAVKALLDEENADSPNALAQLPKNHWWKLFIDKKLHNADDDNLTNAMRFDRDSSPGYYLAMMKAYERHLKDIDPDAEIEQLGSDDIVAMHDQVTAGTLKKEGDDQFVPMPQDLSGQHTNYGVTKGENAIPSLSGMRELIQGGVMGMLQQAMQGVGQQPQDPNDPRSQFIHKASQATAAAHHPFNSRLVPLDNFSAQTDYESNTVRGKIDAFLQQYYGRMNVIRQANYLNAADRQKDQIREIVKLIRALHVSHFFQDANGRLNTMVLLNKFLLENGFKPVIMDDTAVFGGELSVEQLVGQVVRGMNNFNQEIGANPVNINVDRDYSFFSFTVSADNQYIVELKPDQVPAGRAGAIQQQMAREAPHADGAQTVMVGDRIRKLVFGNPEPAERLERTLEAFT